MKVKMFAAGVAALVVLAHSAQAARAVSIPVLADWTLGTSELEVTSALGGIDRVFPTTEGFTDVAVGTRAFGAEALGFMQLKTPAVSADAMVSAVVDPDAFGFMNLKYDFNVAWLGLTNPPVGQLKIRVTASGLLQASENINGFATGNAGFTVQTPGTGLLISENLPNGAPNGEARWDLDQTYKFSPNTTYHISVLAQAVAECPTPPPARTDQTCFAHAFASVDPVFSIDPSTPNADQYMLVFSPGIGNDPIAVPGPVVGAGLPGIIAGCSGLLYLARRRRARAAV
jgi:hypothetical protein